MSPVTFRGWTGSLMEPASEFYLSLKIRFNKELIFILDIRQFKPIECASFPKRTLSTDDCVEALIHRTVKTSRNHGIFQASLEL